MRWQWHKKWDVSLMRPIWLGLQLTCLAARGGLHAIELEDTSQGCIADGRAMAVHRDLHRVQPSGAARPHLAGEVCGAELRNTAGVASYVDLQHVASEICLRSSARSPPCYGEHICCTNPDAKLTYPSAPMPTWTGRMQSYLCCVGTKPRSQ